MRTLIIAMASLAGMGFAHASMAATEGHQCAAPWAEGDAAPSPAVCRDIPQVEKTLVRFEQPAPDQPHVMTRAEVRMELNAIKIVLADQAQTNDSLIASVQPR